MSGWAGPDLSPLVVHRHTDDLSDLRRWLLWRAETEMVQDPADRDGVGDVGTDLERATAASADERIRLKDPGDEPRPAWGAAALLGLLLLVLLVSQFLGGPLAAYAVRVDKDRPLVLRARERRPGSRRGRQRRGALAEGDYVSTARCGGAYAGRSS